MEGQQNICGISITTECPSIQIQEIPSVDFQLKILDGLIGILEASIKPRITVSLFERILNTGTQVVIKPTEINNLHLTTGSKNIGISLDLFDNNEDIKICYGSILSMVKIAVNAMNTLSKRYGLTYLARLSIINSGQANITLTITKTI